MTKKGSRFCFNEMLMLFNEETAQHPAKKVRTILDICVEYNKGEAAKEFQNVSYLLIFDLTVSSSVVGVWSAARNQL